jgi:hypothetical protein
MPGYPGIVLIDDLHFHPGKWALEQPVSRSLWEWTPLDASGFRSTGIGWIYDADFPWVLHAGTGVWLYTHETWSTLSNIWATVLPNEGSPYAVWTSEFFGGWFYRYDLAEDQWQKW